jgi:hypothetical protein
MELDELRTLEIYQLLTAQERRALDSYLSNGRDWVAAVQASYNVTTLHSAQTMARRLRHRPEIQEILRYADGQSIPSAESIALALHRIGVDPNTYAPVAVDALNSAATLFGYKTRTAREPSEEARIERVTKKLANKE